MKLPVTRRSVVLVAVLGLLACSGRTRSACAGRSPEVKLAKIEDVALDVVHAKRQPAPGNGPDGPDNVYESITVEMPLPNVPDEACPSLPAKTTLTFGGKGMVMVARGGGTTKVVSRAADTTTCGPLRAQLTAAELLGGASSGPDVFQIASGAETMTVTFAAGRPRATVAAAEREVVVEMVGLDGKLVDARATPHFAAWAPGAKEGQPLAQKAREGNKLRLDASKLEGKTFTLLGDVQIEPKATCAPAKKTCKVTVRYALRLPLALP